MMRRRDFITLLGGAVAAWPLAARAQQAAMPIVGIIDTSGVNSVVAFRHGLSDGGLEEGRSVVIDYRSTQQYADLRAIADELVRRRVTVIAALGGLPAKEAKAATTTIPIVFCVGGDPVELGLVPNLNRPGGNLTGTTFFAAQLLQKQVGILQDLVPKSATIGVLVNPSNPRHGADARDVQAAARTLGLGVYVAAAGSEAEFDTAFVDLGRHNARALILAGDAFFSHQRNKIVALAARHAIPAIYNIRDYVLAGGLMSYAASLGEAYRHSGIYAARVVRGENPGDLPVMQPTTFQLVINFKAAKALGLTIPPTLLALADEVIE
jgi:putative tryptophan/tyrosine transport system substrate-binding protein